MEKRFVKSRREAGKNPATGRSAGRGEGGSGRVISKGRPSQGGVDLQTLDQLQEAGLLSSEGRRLRDSMNPGREDAGRPQRAQGSMGREAGPRGSAPRSRIEGDRPRPRSEGEALRPRLRPGTAPVGLTTARPGQPERLHKVMAQAGLASRRHSEELIQAGRVTVNGQVVIQLGTKVTPGKDLIEVDGRPLGKAEDPVYILLNKPKGYVTTLFDPQGRKKVTDLLGGEIGQRVYPVGRLDYDTEGLLLLTNDGELANALMHPSQQIKKSYIAKVRGVPNGSKITQLEQGVELEDGMTAPAEVKLIEAHGPNAASLSIRIHEGRNRQVRRMFEAVGHEVISLRRTSMGPLHIKSLRVGEWRDLSPHELKDLRTAVGDKVAARAAFIADKAALRGKGRPALEGGDQAYGTKPFSRPARTVGSTRFDRAESFDGPREGRPKPFGGAARTDGPRSFGGASRGDGPKDLGAPTRADGPKPLGGPTRGDSPKPFGGRSRADAPKPFGGPTRTEGVPARKDGARALGAPKPFGSGGRTERPNRSEGGKPFARPAKEFYPRTERKDGGPRRRP